MGETKFKVGDIVELVQLVGIVYERGAGRLRIQKPNGEKVREVPEAFTMLASPQSITQFKSEAIQGVSPEAIIAREKAELEAKLKAAEEAAKKAAEESEGDHDPKEE